MHGWNPIFQNLKINLKKKTHPYLITILIYIYRYSEVRSDQTRGQSTKRWLFVSGYTAGDLRGSARLHFAPGLLPVQKETGSLLRGNIRIFLGGSVNSKNYLFINIENNNAHGFFNTVKIIAYANWNGIGCD